MQALKINENLLVLNRNTLIFRLAIVLSLCTTTAVGQNSLAMVGFGMGQNFSTNEFYYRGTMSVFSTESMWGAYQAFEYRPPQEVGGVHFKLPTGLYARLRGPLYVHYGLDVVTSVAFNDKVRHDVGASLRFKGVQLKFNYAGPNGWSAQIAVPVQ
jgi:hypothetical protein